MAYHRCDIAYLYALSHCEVSMFPEMSTKLISIVLLENAQIYRCFRDVLPSACDIAIAENDFLTRSPQIVNSLQEIVTANQCTWLEKINSFTN